MWLCTEKKNIPTGTQYWLKEEASGISDRLIFTSLCFPGGWGENSLFHLWGRRRRRRREWGGGGGVQITGALALYYVHI